MKKAINKAICDTDKAHLLGFKHYGEFGNPDGYEERLFVTEDEKYFLYGVGGEESPYIKAEFKLLTAEEAEAWKKENGIA